MAEMNEPTTETKQNEIDKRPPRLPLKAPAWTMWISIPIIIIGALYLYVFFTQFWPHLPRFAGTYRIEVRTNPIDGAAVVYVPGGEFAIGSEFSPGDKNPVHAVYLDTYWIYQTEVTNYMYALCVAAGDCNAPDSDHYGNENYANYPVVNVSIEDARNYCTWAEGDLPTRAEWEKAARGTDGRTYPWGEGLSTTLANLDADPVAVGRYPKGSSPYGALDMAGNVTEWVLSARYGIAIENWPDKTSPVGFWDNSIDTLHIASRTTDSSPFLKGDHVGFRCVLLTAP